MFSCGRAGMLSKEVILTIAMFVVLVDSKMRSCYFGPVMDPDHGQQLNKHHWLKSALAKIQNGCPRRVRQASPNEFNCSAWDTYSARDLAEMASSGNIGHYGRKCRIQGDKGDTTTCKWHIVCDNDGNSTDDWQRFTSSVSGHQSMESGCCSSTCNTAVEAGACLKDFSKHICCGGPFYHPDFSCTNWDSFSADEFADMATTGIIGERGRKCRIASSVSASCKFYVRYDVDGDDSDAWKGLTWDTVPRPGGSGCCSRLTRCATASEAGAWLKAHHKSICCGQ